MIQKPTIPQSVKTETQSRIHFITQQGFAINTFISIALAYKILFSI